MSLPLKKWREINQLFSKKLPCDVFTLYATLKREYPEKTDEQIKLDVHNWVDTLDQDMISQLIMETRYEVDTRKKIYNRG
jgi:hypothetical protein